MNIKPVEFLLILTTIDVVIRTSAYIYNAIKFYSKIMIKNLKHELTTTLYYLTHKSIGPAHIKSGKFPSMKYMKFIDENEQILSGYDNNLDYFRDNY